MKTFQKLLFVSHITVSSLLLAAPTPVSGPLPGSGDGLNSKWVGVDPSIVTHPHNIAGAENALSLNSGDPGVLAFFQGVVPSVDHRDSNQLISGDVFALRYSGFLNVTLANTYTFQSYHDDGVRVRLGGEDIIVYNSDTSPTTTGSAALTLNPGLYPIEVLTWEQGGIFESSLRWQTGTTPFELVPQSVFFSSNPNGVPDSVSTGLLLAVMGSLMLLRRSSAK